MNSLLYQAYFPYWSSYYEISFYYILSAFSDADWAGCSPMECQEIAHGLSVKHQSRTQIHG
jgi:hypothetical protein